MKQRITGRIRGHHGTRGTAIRNSCRMARVAAKGLERNVGALAVPVKVPCQARSSRTFRAPIPGGRPSSGLGPRHAGNHHKMPPWSGAAYSLLALFFDLLAESTTLLVAGLPLFVRISTACLSRPTPTCCNPAPNPACSERIFTPDDATYGGVRQVQLRQSRQWRRDAAAAHKPGDACAEKREAPMRLDKISPVALGVPPAQVVRPSGGRGWQSLDAAEILHPEDGFAVPTLPRHVLVFNLAPPTATAERRSGRSASRDEVGLIILSAGRPRDWHLDYRREARQLHRSLDPALARGVAADAGLDPSRLEIVDAVGIREARVAHTGTALLAELRAPASEGQAYAEGLTTMLAAQLLRRHSSVGPAAMGCPDRLSPAALQRATTGSRGMVRTIVRSPRLPMRRTSAPTTSPVTSRRPRASPPPRSLSIGGLHGRGCFSIPPTGPSRPSRGRSDSPARHLAPHCRRLARRIPGGYR